MVELSASKNMMKETGIIDHTAPGRMVVPGAIIHLAIQAKVSSPVVKTDDCSSSQDIDMVSYPTPLEQLHSDITAQSLPTGPI